MEYKLRIVAEYDALMEFGARGALLRREGLYQSHVEKWRAGRDQGRLVGPGQRPAVSGATSGAASWRSGSASAVPGAQVAKMAAENAALTAELEKTKAVLEIMGKAHALLEILSESAGMSGTSPTS